MATVQRHIGNLGIWSARRFGLIAVLAVVSLAIAFGTLIPPPGTAHAESSEPWLYMECVESPVEEGDDFRLVVRKKYKDHTAPYKKMRVFWYTEAQTADETDYEHMYAVRQASNGHQSETGKMGRDFHTLDDIIPESDETYLVKFNNSNDDGDDGECYITIKDDDGVGIHDLEIRSVPGEIPWGTNNEDSLTAYTQGDVILITAHFTHPVTTVNPDTGEQTDYAGLYLQAGENRRVANVVRGDGTDEIIFGYTVQADDEDLDGISVENGWAGTGLYYNEETRDSGLWPVNSDDGRLNRVFYGLSDDPEHLVAQVDVGEPTITPPVEDPLIEEPSIVEPDLPEWIDNAENIEPNLLGKIDGELTAEDEGRDWYGFEATGGEDYFIELVSALDLAGPGPEEHFFIQYVENKLIDPSILEIVNEEGEQVMGEHDQGGFINNWARAHFTPQDDGAYYIAVGSGAQAPGYLGFYTLSVRVDDYADDYKTARDVTLHPGESITACIDSDVSPDDPGINAWDWWETQEGHARPLYGLESLDDRDFFKFEIAEEGIYELSVTAAPEPVGIWATYLESGHVRHHSEPDPAQSVVDHYHPGTHFVEIGTPWQSVGNTGLYTVSLDRIEHPVDPAVDEEGPESES